MHICKSKFARRQFNASTGYRMSRQRVGGKIQVLVSGMKLDPFIRGTDSKTIEWLAKIPLLLRHYNIDRKRYAIYIEYRVTP